MEIFELIPAKLRPTPGRGTAFPFIVLPGKRVIFDAQTKAHWRQSFRLQREWKNTSGGDDTWLEAEIIANHREPKNKSKRWRQKTRLIDLKPENRMARYVILPYVYRSREGEGSDRDRYIIVECEDNDKRKKDWNDLVLFVTIE